MNLKRVDLNLLVALDALLDERNVTRAADRLAMSQPALSNALRRMRSLFGDPLFLRGQRGLVPTPRAMALAGPLKELLSNADALVRPQAFDPREADVEFRLATTDYMAITLVAPLLEHLRQIGSGIRITVRSLETTDIPERLAHGELDLAISIPEFSAQHLQSRRLYSDHYVGVVRHEHPLTQEPRPSVQRFCSYPQVLVAPAGGAITGPVDVALARLGAARSIQVSVPSFLLLPHLLVESDLVAVCPSRLSTVFSEQLSTFGVPVEVSPFDVIGAWHARSQNDPAHRWLRQTLADVVA